MNLWPDHTRQADKTLGVLVILVALGIAVSSVWDMILSLSGLMGDIKSSTQAFLHPEGSTWITISLLACITLYTLRQDWEFSMSLSTAGFVAYWTVALACLAVSYLAVCCISANMTGFLLQDTLGSGPFGTQVCNTTFTIALCMLYAAAGFEFPQFPCVARAILMLAAALASGCELVYLILMIVPLLPLTTVVCVGYLVVYFLFLE